MRRNPKICRPVRAAAKCASPTAFAPLVDIMQKEPLSRVRKIPKIGIDIMGSDNDPAQILASLDFPSSAQFSCLAIGTEQYKDASPIPYHIAQDFIAMDENPLSALRHKKQASIPLGMKLLKEGAIDALVSAGNTGALVSSAKMTLGTFAPLHRPALLAMIPTKKKPVAVVDVGANIQVKTEHMVHFALIATAYLRARGIENPTIGLLNIGSEPIKGTAESRLTYHALQNLKNPPFRFVGNIEGKSVFDGDVNGLITDGFTGNVLLKTAEGLVSLMLYRLSSDIPPEMLEKLTLQLGDLRQHLNYADYPGALLAGVKKIVIKCHGYSTPQTIAKAVAGAADLVSQKFIDAFQEKLNRGFRYTADGL